MSTYSAFAVLVAAALICAAGCETPAPTRGPDPATETAGPPAGEESAPVTDTSDAPAPRADDPARRAYLRHAGALPHIAAYKGGCRGAVSLTFDDGFRHQVENAVEILDETGLTGTFFLIPLRMENPKAAHLSLTWERARELIDAGHEIGTHGAIAEKLHEVTDERLDYLVNESWRLIAERTGTPPVSYARPGGSKAGEREQAVIFQNHYFFRKETCWDKLEILGYGNTERKQWDDERTRRRITELADDGYWTVATIHAIVKGYAPFKSKDEFREHCRWLASNDDLWVAPMGVVGRYVKARDAATLELEALTPGEVRFRLRCDLEPASVFGGRLTVSIPTGGATAAEAVGENGSALPTTVRDGVVYVEAPTTGEPVTVTWAADPR